MDRRRAAGALLALAACIACSAAAPTVSDHTALDLYDGTSEGCYYNFQHYGEGDRIMTNEPCLNCTCHNKMLMCYLRVCPFTKPIGQDCTVEKRADQCCPIVTCPDVPVDLLTSTSTTSPAEYGATGIGKLDKYGCSINGKHFPEGSKVPPTPNKPCEHCYCIRNMTTCVMQECTLHVDGCTPIYHKDVCCPVRYSCDHPEDEILLLDDMTTTVRPTPGFLLTTTTLSPVTQMTQDCVHDDQVFADGALIKTEKACEHCYCMKGDIVCVVQECGTPMENEGKNCSSLPPREGQCCPDTYICEGDESSTESPSDIMVHEDITTLSPPRRVGVEGSGYRNEPDEAPQTESSATETDIEGSGEEQSNILQGVDTSELFAPKTSTPAISDEYLATTEKEQQYVTKTSESPKLDESEVGTKFPESSHGIDITPEEVNTVSDHDVSSITNIPTKEEQYTSSTTTAFVQDVETSTAKPIDGQNIIPGTISEKESSELDQFIPITTSAPLVDNGEEDTTDSTGNQDIIPSTTPVSSEQEQTIPIITSEPTIEEVKEPSIEPYDGQDVKPGDTINVETEEPEDYSSITTSKPRLEETETSSVGQDISEPEIVTEKKHLEIDQHISSTQLPEIDEGDVYTTETSESHEETPDIITEKESEPEFIPVTTTIPIAHETEKESTRPNIVSEDITEKESSNLDQFIPITTSLPTVDVYDHLTTKLTSEKDTTASFVESTVSLVPEKYIPTTMTSPVVEKDEKVTTAISHEESSVPDHFITKTTATSLIGLDELSTITPNEEQYLNNGTIEKEISKSQPTSTPVYEEEEKIAVGIDKEHVSVSDITSEEQTSESEEPKFTEPTTSKKHITSGETTTIAFDVSSTYKEDLYTITTETTLRKEDSVVPTDSQKQYETTASIESVTESIDVETKPTILTLLEDQKTTKKEEIKEPIESTTTVFVKEDEKEPISDTEEELTPTTPAADKLNLPETTTINIGDNEIDEDSIINSGRIPGEGDCLLNGITYRNESVVPSTNNCHIGCRCISSIIKCEPVICSPPPEYMNNCQPTYDSSESCCPTYVCDHSKETIPPESQSQMSGTESPVPSPAIECRGDQCEISEENVHICTSSDCLKEPSAKPESIDCSLEDCSHIETPTQPQPVEHPEECEPGKCEPSKESCANGDCQRPPIVEQALPVKPCEGDHCEEKPDISQSLIPQTPILTCEGESGLGDCSSTVVSLPQDAKKDVTCTEENGCQKTQEESKLECVGESCRRKGSSDIDSKLPSPCAGSDCAQQTPTQHSLDTDISITKSPVDEIYTLDTTLTPLVTKDQEAQTELPASYAEVVTTTTKATEMYMPQDHVSSNMQDLITKTTSVSSLNDLTTILPGIISESTEIQSPDDKLHKNDTTELPQTENIHLEKDTTKQDVPIISDLETELTTKSLFTENQDIHTETPLSPTEKPHDAETETPLSPTEIPLEVETKTPSSSTEKSHNAETETPLSYTEKPLDIETKTTSSPTEKPHDVESETPLPATDKLPDEETPLPLTEKPLDIETKTTLSPTEKPYDVESETPLPVTEKLQDIETETPLSPTEKPHDVETEIPLSPTEKPHDVQIELSEPEKDMIVTQTPETIIKLYESTTVGIDKYENQPTKLPGTDQAVGYTEKPSEIPETSDCGSEDCSHKETLTHPETVEQNKECKDGKCEPSRESCDNGECHVPSIGSLSTTESPIYQQPLETEKQKENDMTPQFPTISEIMEGETGSTKLMDYPVTPKMTDEFTEILHETPEIQTTQLVDVAEPQELITKKYEHDISHTESPELYVTETYNETKLVPDVTETDQSSHEITKTPETVTEPGKETKLPISELDEVSTKLSDPHLFKEPTTEQYDKMQESITTLSQEVSKIPKTTVTEIIPTLSNELVTEKSGIPHIPEVETDKYSTMEVESTTKASLLTVTISKNQDETTQAILEDHKTEIPSLYTTKAQESFTNENEQPITDLISLTMSHVTGSPIAVTADLEQQEMITEKIEISTEQEKPSITEEKETHPESHDTEPQNITPPLTTQEEIISQETLIPSITEQTVTTESVSPISDEEKIKTEPPNIEKVDISIDHSMMTEEPDQTTDKSETEISDNEKIKTESPEPHDDQEKTSTKRPTDKEIMLEYPGQLNLVEKEEESSTEIPIESVTEKYTPDTESMEPIVTEKEHEQFHTVTTKPLISDETSKTGQHDESPEKLTPSFNEMHDENTEVPTITSKQPISSQSELSTSEPHEDSTGKEYITPPIESATNKYQEDVLTDKTPQIEIEYSGPYIPVHQEEPSTGTPIVQETDLLHKVSESYEGSATEQYDMPTKPSEFLEESYTEISNVDLTEPQESLTEAPEVAITEEAITKLPGVVTDASDTTDEKLEKTTESSKSPITEIHSTFTESPKISEPTETPLSLVTESHVTKKPEDVTDHKTTELIETSNVGEDLDTEVPKITSPQEYVTKIPGISDIKDNEIQTESVSVIPEKTESSTKSAELPVSETFTSEPLGHEVETKMPEMMFTESQILVSTKKPMGSTTLAEEIYTEQPSKLHITGSEQTDTDSSPIITEDELLMLSTESSIPLVTEVQQIATKQSETHDISIELQNTSTETPKKSKPDEQEQQSDSYLPVTTESQVSITKKSEIVTEQNKITTMIPDQFATEKSDVLLPEPHETKEPVETSSKLPLPEENIITISDESHVTSVPKYETPESTPYLIELEEHTHKLEEELSTTVFPELTTRNVDKQPEQKVSEITTETPRVEDSTSEVDIMPVKDSVDSLHPTDDVYEKTTQSSVSLEETTSLPITSELYPLQEVDNKNGAITVITDPSTLTPLTIEIEQTTLKVPASTGVSSIQDLVPTEQIDDEKVASSEKPHELEMPFATTPSEEGLITTTLKPTTPKSENITLQTPAPIDEYTKTEEKPTEIMPPVPESSKPNDIQPTDEVPPPEDGGQIAPSGSSGYGPEPDYFEEDQTFGPGTCRYGGKVYVSAQQIPRDDPCDFCFCFRSDIICLQQSCPPPIHGCHEEPIQGFCCPRYECPVSMATTLNVTTTTTTTTTTLPPHFPTHPYKGAAQRRGCQIKGHTYKVGEVVRASSGPCLHCTCGGDGQMKCDPKACTPEPMLRQMIAAAVSAKRRR